MALQLADCGDLAALQIFLATRLVTLAVSLGGARSGGGAAAAASASVFGGGVVGAGGGGPGSGPERAQCTLVSAWLTELYLDAINRALLEVRCMSCRVLMRAVKGCRTCCTTGVENSWWCITRGVCLLMACLCDRLSIPSFRTDTRVL